MLNSLVKVLEYLLSRCLAGVSIELNLIRKVGLWLLSRYIVDNLNNLSLHNSGGKLTPTV